MALSKSGGTSHTHGRLSAAGGIAIKMTIAAAPATAVSVLIPGITANDTLESVVAFRLSGVLLKSAVTITGSTIKAAGGAIILGSAPGTANIPLIVNWAKNE